MDHDQVVPLAQYYAQIQQTGTPNYLLREMERLAPAHIPGLDELLPELLDFLGQDDVLPERLRSPLIRSAERRAAVEKAVARWLERQEREHPERGLTASPQFVRQLCALAGLGLLEPLLADPQVSEVIVENDHSILVEKGGRTIPVKNLSYPSEDALRRQAIALCSLSNRPLSVDSPLQTFFFSDGSRVTVAIPPVAHRGTIMNIRRKSATALALADLAGRGALSAEVVAYLHRAVQSWANVVVCGESGCGKTTLLQALIDAMSTFDRGMVVQENDELSPTHPHLRYLLASPDAAQKGISLRDCTRFSMLFAPRRLIVGEAKEGEAADLLFAMTSGLSGCMTTIHANPGADALDRLYIAALMDPGRRYGEGGDVLRRAIVAAVDLVVHVAFSPQGRRHVDAVHEVWPLRDDGSWDVRPAWEAHYGGAAGEELTWQQPSDYQPSPRMQARLQAYQGRAALEEQELPETPVERDERLARSYREAVALGGLGRYEEALPLLRALAAEQPGYLDVDRLLLEYASRQEDQAQRAEARLQDLEDRARDAAQRGDLGTAAWFVDEIEALSPPRAVALRAAVAGITDPVQEEQP